MKIVHCADIHLDSPMSRLSNGEKRKERRAELIKAFKDMTCYASEIGAGTVIIAGDLFDRSRVSATAKNAVLGAIKEKPEIGFYYLKGNHDQSDFLSEEEDIPANLHMFGTSWTTYDLGENIFLTGVELTKENASSVYSELGLNMDNFNIVTLHGQESVSSAVGDAQVVSLRDLKNRNIDYLALGHIHSFKYEVLDRRGFYCYPGCLEARGFDETGEHGFMVLDIDGKAREFKLEAIGRPIRSAHILPVDISGLVNSTQIIDKIKDELYSAAFPSRDLVKIELTGDVDLECDKNLSFIEKTFEGNYYDLKLKDNTRFKVDYAKYALDESLKGEFIRTVEAADSISPEDKAEIIRIGIQALMGEEVE